MIGVGRAQSNRGLSWFAFLLNAEKWPNWSRHVHFVWPQENPNEMAPLILQAGFGHVVGKADN